MSDIDVAHGQSLTAFLERQLNVEAKKSGLSMRFSYCPHCGDNGHIPFKLQVQADDQHYFCHRCKTKGSIIDAAMALWGYDFKEALEKLVAGKSGAVKRLPVDVEKIKYEEQLRNEKIKQVLELLHPLTLRFADDFKCLKYLTEVRKIPIEIVREAQKRKILGFLPSDSKKAERLIIATVGEKLLRESGMWKEGAKKPAICFRPIIFFLPGFASAEFRIIGEPKPGYLKSIRYGTKIKYPFVWRAKSGSKAAVVEGCIDMMSMVALGFKGHVIGLPGCSSWNADWFVTIKDTIGVSEYIRALDNDSGSKDNPGQSGSEKLRKVLEEKGLPQSEKVLPPDSDINEILIAKRAA